MNNLKKLYKDRIKGLKYEAISKPSIIIPLVILLVFITIVILIFKFDLVYKIANLLPSSQDSCSISIALENGKANIFIDDKQIGTTPLNQYSVSCKEHKLRVERQSPNNDFYYKYSENITFTQNETITIKLNLGASYEGSEILTIRNIPSTISSTSIFVNNTKADIYINGSLHGTTPYTYLPNSYGDIEIMIKAEGYKTINFSTETNSKNSTTIDSKLMLIPILYE